MATFLKQATVKAPSLFLFGVAALCEKVAHVAAARGRVPGGAASAPFGAAPWLGWLALVGLAHQIAHVTDAAALERAAVTRFAFAGADAAYQPVERDAEAEVEVEVEGLSLHTDCFL